MNGSIQLGPRENTVKVSYTFEDKDGVHEVDLKFKDEDIRYMPEENTIEVDESIMQKAIDKAVEEFYKRKHG